MSRPLSHTASSTYNACQRKFYFDRILRLEIDRPKGSLRMGAAFAQCLEDGGDKRLDRYYDKALDGLALTVDEYDDVTLEREIVRLYQELYLDRYGEPRADMEREHAFQSKTFGNGCLDGIIDGTVGVEDKFLTPGFWRAADEKKLAIDAQVTRYFAAMREAGKPLTRMQYRVTFKPTIKVDSRKGETRSGYLDRLRDRIINDPDKTFRVFDLYRTDGDLDAYTGELAALREELAYKRRQFKRIGEAAYRPNRGPACTQFGECAFLSLCAGDHDADTKYRVKGPDLSVLPKSQQRVLSAIKQSLTTEAWIPDVAKQAGMTDNATRSAVRGLVKRGLIERVKHGRSVCVRAV